MNFSPYIVEVLKEERFDLAFVHLEEVFRTKPSADIALQAAILYTMTEKEQTENAFDALSLAAETDPSIEDSALFIATRGLLLSESQAPEATEDLNLTRKDPDPLVAFLTARGFMNMGAYQKTINILKKVNPESLPFFMQWRYHVILIAVYKGIDEDEKAVQHSAVLLKMNIPSEHKIIPALDVAASLDDQNKSTELVELLTPLTPTLQKVAVAEDQLSWYSYLAQHLLNLNRYTEALHATEQAYRLEQETQNYDYETALLYGQILLAQGKALEAIRFFKEALEITEDTSYCLHELGIAYIDADMLLEAEECLSAAVKDMDYPYTPEALADLADCHYRLGHLTQAEQEALEALEQGAVVSGSMVLGGIAMEYYHLRDAYRHYERVAEHSPEGSREWVIAQQNLADILVQEGFRDPALIFEYTENALRFTEQSDDMFLTLQGFMARARDMLENKDSRTLN